MEKKLQIVKYIGKGVALVVVFGTIALLLWRIFSSGDPQAVKSLMVDDHLRAVYAADEDGKLTAYWQENDNITRVAKKNNGYFSVRRGLFIDEADQVQVTFRYNNSTLRHLKEDYKLDVIPGRDEDMYDVSLVVVYDLTPDDDSDNGIDATEHQEGAVRIERFFPDEDMTESYRHNVYNYRKFVFNGVDITDAEAPVLFVFVDIYYKGDIDYEKDSYGTLPIYDYTRKSQNKAYPLTRKDKAALTEETQS